MLHMPRIPELAQRDRFIRRAVSEGRVLTLADEENASVASQKVAGRTVQLFWSSPIEAGRWAEALAGNTDLQDIPLTTFAADILPGIATAKGLVGTDWVADPIEAEVDPRDLQIRLKVEAVQAYVNAARGRGEVFLVGDDDGLMLTPATPKPGSGDVLHVFRQPPRCRAAHEDHRGQAGHRRSDRRLHRHDAALGRCACPVGDDRTDRRAPVSSRLRSPISISASSSPPAAR